MKRIVLAALLAGATSVALAQAPASDVPKMKCEPKPEYPGRLAMQSDNRRKLFDKDMKAYKDCVNAYIDERKAGIKANEAAAQAAIDEHNAVMKTITDAQTAARQ